MSDFKNLSHWGPIILFTGLMLLVQLSMDHLRSAVPGIFPTIPLPRVPLRFALLAVGILILGGLALLWRERSARRDFIISALAGVFLGIVLGVSDLANG